MDGGETPLALPAVSSLSRRTANQTQKNQPVVKETGQQDVFADTFGSSIRAEAGQETARTGDQPGSSQPEQVTSLEAAFLQAHSDASAVVARLHPWTGPGYRGYREALPGQQLRFELILS